MSAPAELPGDLPLRDQLALERTQLANRRTWLASARTALTLFVSGAGFLKFFEDPIFEIVGWAFIVGSVPLVGVGWWRFRVHHKRLEERGARALRAPSPS